jgi:hypothetical protein
LNVLEQLAELRPRGVHAGAVLLEDAVASKAAKLRDLVGKTGLLINGRRTGVSDEFTHGICL